MAEQSDYSKYILPVGILAVVGLAAQKFGLLPSSESRKAESNAAALDSKKEFQPGYAAAYAKSQGWKKYKTYYLKQARALALASDIKKAKGIFNDDETAVYSTLKNVNYKAQLSQVAETFRKQYGTDMVEYLKSFLNEKELSRVFDLGELLPPGVEQA